MSPTAEKRSFCRLCQGMCGVVVTLDAERRLVAVRGDHDDPQTLGFACARGIQAADTHYSPDRLLKPLKRTPDGAFQPISQAQALDEIAEKLRVIIDRDGPEAIAGYRGGGGYFNSSSAILLNDWLAAIGSPKVFTNVTIDQSAKMVAPQRIGVWPPGPQPIQGSDVALLIGNNPLVSVSGLDTRNPHKRLKQLKARGLKLLVIDPRRTETAAHADLHLQPLPGEDSAILAAMLRLILDEGWHDRAFCERHVGDLDRLRQAVDPFTPEYAARRADAPAAQIRRMAEMFARDARRGCANTATGACMAPHSNLTEHLVGCLNIVCGRLVREGEQIGNPGFLLPRYPRPAQVIPGRRPGEAGARSRIGGYGELAPGTIHAQMPTGIMADEILTPGEGQVRALLCHGGNPAGAVPDQRKIVRAFRSLELLVTIEPFMNATARLSHYVLPPKVLYERADLPLYMWEAMYPTPYTRYTPPIVDPPKGAEVFDEFYIFWALARRLGLQLTSGGVALDMSRPPTEDEILGVIVRNAPVPFEEIKRHEHGIFHDDDPQFATPAAPGWPHRFTLMPDDVEQELLAIAAEALEPGVTRIRGVVFSHRLVTRRIRERFNSGPLTPDLRRRAPRNVAYLNGADMARAGLADGDWIEIASDHGTIRVVAEADDTVRSGVVSITHGFGGLPEDADADEDGSAYLRNGVCVNLLISTDRDLQTLNAMPRMSGVPVNIRKADAQPRAEPRPSMA